MLCTYYVVVGDDSNTNDPSGLLGLPVPSPLLTTQRAITNPANQEGCFVCVRVIVADVLFLRAYLPLVVRNIHTNPTILLTFAPITPFPSHPLAANEPITSTSEDVELLVQFTLLSSTEKQK